MGREKLSPVLLDMRLGMPPPKGDEKNDDTVDKREKGREGITSMPLDARSRVSYSNDQCNTSNCGAVLNSHAVSYLNAYPSHFSPHARYLLPFLMP